MNTAAIYDSAIAGLQYAQAGMVATSQNVTGSNVAGYVRRNPDLRISTMSPSSTEIGGTAFSVEGFTRHFSSLLQNQLLAQQSKTSYTATLTQAVSTLDAMLVDPSASIAKALGSFFNAAGSLANDPQNPAYQQALIGASLQVGDRIRGLAELVDRLKLDSAQGMADVLNQANTLAPQLADVNARIKAASVPGVSYPSGDLLDERDRITSQLQQLIGGTTVLNEDGTASYLVDGVHLVDRVRSNQWGGAVNSKITSDDILNNHVQLLSPGSFGQGGNGILSSDVRLASFKDGQAGAYALLVGNFAPTLEKGVNLLAYQLADKVNSLDGVEDIFGFKATSSSQAQSDGWRTLNIAWPNVNLANTDFAVLLDRANPSSLPTYDSLFDQSLQGFDAKTFYARAIEASGQLANRNMASSSASALAELRGDFAEPVTFITSSVASSIATWKNNHKTNEIMSQVLSDQKSAISGVNLDEEAANLVKYQQLYNASSKLIQTNRQMFDTLLAMLSGN